MAQFEGFNAEGVEPSQSFEPIPVANYQAMVLASEVKDTKAGTGKYIQLEWTIVEGPYQGRKVWQRINYLNPSPQAQEIGQRELSAVCHATGRIRINDTSELHEIPCLIYVTIEKGNGDYAPKNNVGGVKPLQQLQQAAPPQSPAPGLQRPAALPPRGPASVAQPQRASAPAASSGKPPWASPRSTVGAQASPSIPF